MKQSLVISNINVNLRQNPKARRIIIKIRHGEVDLVIPRRANVNKAIKFFESKADWVRSRLAHQPEKIGLRIGITLPVMDKPHLVTYAGIRGKSVMVNDNITISGDPMLAPQKIKKVVSDYLKSELTNMVEEAAQKLGVNYQKIVIRDNVTRWGSASSRGTLSFCWRIVFAPRYVVEYLACHEVAHLREMNHGPKYWPLVEQIYPNYALAEHWLKKNGGSLHLYQ